MANSQRILVTGAAGFIGSHLVERLLDEGAQVFGLDSFSASYDPSIKRRNLANCLHHPAFTMIETDIRDRERLKAVFDIYEFDLIVHLAASVGVQASLQEPQIYSEINVTGTINLLDAARRSGVKPFIYSSSAEVYGASAKLPFSETEAASNPSSVYAATQRSAELLCNTWHQLYGMSIACIRFFSVYGPRQRPDQVIHSLSRNLLAEEEVKVYATGASSRDYLYISDAVDGILKTIDFVQAGCIYECINLGASVPVSFSAMMAYLEEQSGLKFKQVYHETPLGEQAHSIADISKAGLLLGFKPLVSFAEGIKLWWDWFSSRTED